MWNVTPRCALLFSLLLLGCPSALCAGSDSAAKKLLIDNGRYEESEWARQLAVTADDRFLIATDTKYGVRVYDLANGGLINSMEGHSLDGDSYYDVRAGILVTTGDRTIKIWDVPTQKLLKRIQQSFHSQFMQNVYVDTRRQFVFAQGVKYRFDTGQMVKQYEVSGIDRLADRYFFQDRYYLFDDRTGRMRGYDCFSDELLTTYTLSQYRQGTDRYFDDRTGRLFIGYLDGVRVIDIVTGRSDFASFDRKGAYSNVGSTSSYAVSKDGKFLVAGSNQGVGLVVVKKVDAGAAFAGNTREVLRDRLEVGEIHSLNATNKVVYTTRDAIQLLDLDTMRLLWRTEPKTLGLRNIHLGPEGTQLYIDFGSQAKVNRHWFERTFAHPFDTYFDRLDANWGTFKPDLRDADLPKELLPMWRERSQTARLGLEGDLTLETVPAKLPFPATGTSATPYDPVSGVVRSPTGRYALESKDFGKGTLYDRGRPIGQAPNLGVVYHVEYSPDERYVALGGSNRWVAVLDLSTGETVRKVYAESYVTSITFSSNHDYMFTGSLKNEIMMWRLRDGRLIRRFTGSNGSVLDTEITPDGKRLLSIAEDGALRFWDVSTGNMLVAVFFLNVPHVETSGGRNARRPWVVVTPEGRFDTNDLDEIRGLHWILQDDPLHALPLEIFMRDYYEPRLLPRVLAGERFRELPELGSLNRVQPEVKIVGVEREGGGDTVRVMVEVSGAGREFGEEGQRRTMSSGVYDLRLFRDGQLVGQRPAEAATQSKLGMSAVEELAQWRTERLVARPEEGTKKIVFEGIRLPRLAGVKEVQFTAYAFNEDRVKSETARPEAYAMPVDLTPRAARAYVVTVGVNAFEDPRWDLRYAANDARQSGSILKTRLESLRDESGGKRYEQVIWVPLIAQGKPAAPQNTKAQATKAQIEAVLKALAGQPADVAVLREIPGAEGLRRVNPEDLVVIMVSTHGIVDKKRGGFYFLPADIGKEFAGTEAQLRRAVSNDELAAWLHGLDARDQVMIVDACHSAASVQSAEFKPGPMGSRGLGQLAYDQGMRILAATQVDQYALETPQTQLGLLSYALVHDGLENGKADYKPKDGKTYLSEWLSYAAVRVPELYRQTDTGEKELKGRTRGEVVWKLNDQPGNASRATLQQPQLFDFARKSDPLISNAAAAER